MTSRSSAASKPAASPSINQGLQAIQAWIDQPDQFNSSSFEEDKDRLEDIDICHSLLLQAIGNESDAYLHGRFERVELIGAGTYGVVFRAWEVNLQRDVAIKILRPSLHMAKSAMQRFELEGIILAKCSFAGIIPVYEVGKLSDMPFMVMKFAKGQNLAIELRKRGRPFSVIRSVELIETIALGIHAAHQQGIVHRDLKPSNLLIDATNCDDFQASQILISDFGMARDMSLGEPKLTVNERAIIGTIAYMSPEQARGDSRQTSVASDIYSIGVVFFELLTLQTPFHGGSSVAMLHRVASEQPPTVRSINRSIPRDISAIVRKCLALAPSDRYSSALELIRDLRAWREGKPVTAEQHSLWVIAKWIRRNPAISLLSALLLLSLTFGIIASLRLIRNSREQLVIANAERSRANANLQIAMDSVDELYQAAEKTLRNVPNSDAKKLELYLTGLSFAEKFAIHHNGDERSLRRLSIALHYAANAAQQIPGKSDVERGFRIRQYNLLLELARKNPSNADYQFDLFHNRFWHWVSLGQARFSNPAILEQASQHLESAIQLAPDRLDYREAFVSFLLQQASTLPISEQKSQIEKAIAISKDLSNAAPDISQYRKGNLYGSYMLASLAYENQEFINAKQILETLSEDLEISKFNEWDEPGFLILKSDGLRLQTLIDIKIGATEWEVHFDEYVSFLLQLSIQDDKYQDSILLPVELALQLADTLIDSNRIVDAAKVLTRVESIFKLDAWKSPLLFDKANELTSRFIEIQKHCAQAP